MKLSILHWVKRFIWAFLLFQALMVLGFSIWVSPDSIEAGEVRITEPCPVFVESGTPCATCGVTRGLCAMGHFQWVRAYNYNPIAVVLFFLECGILSLGWKFRPWRASKLSSESKAQG